MNFYVIMPVSLDKNFSRKKELLEQIAQQAGLIPCLPIDKRVYPSFQLGTTLTVLRDSEFVLADLSFERPSCYYELGLTQALGKTVFLMAERGTVIHQVDGRDQIRFYTDLSEYQKLVSEILHKAVNRNKSNQQ
jgi:hypothetical protein